MRTIIFFTIIIVTGSTMFGDNNCCEQCCEYLGNCCKKGKEEEKKKTEEIKEGEGKKEEKKEEEVQKKFCLKKLGIANPEAIKKLVSPNWYDNKNNASFILYEKIDNIEDGGLNNNDEIKVTKDKNGFSIDENFIPEKNNNEQKWALFEIIYKEKKEEEGKTVYLHCSDIESTIANESVYGIFESCKQHISISVIACDTSGVTNMSAMFYMCSSLTGLDLSKFDTKNVIDMYSMFFYCKKLNNLDLSKFDTKNVTNMSAMFYNCSSLTGLDLSNFNTSKVKDMEGMFYMCSSLTDLDLPNFNTGNVEKMVDMFFGCSSLQTVTFNKNLNERIVQPLKTLGLTEEVKEEEGNKITLKKKQQI